MKWSARLSTAFAECADLIRDWYAACSSDTDGSGTPHGLGLWGVLGATIALVLLILPFAALARIRRSAPEPGELAALRDADRRPIHPVHPVQESPDHA